MCAIILELKKFKDFIYLTSLVTNRNVTANSSKDVNHIYMYVLNSFIQTDVQLSMSWTYVRRKTNTNGFSVIRAYSGIITTAWESP